MKPLLILGERATVRMAKAEAKLLREPPRIRSGLSTAFLESRIRRATGCQPPDPMRSQTGNRCGQTLVSTLRGGMVSVPKALVIAEQECGGPPHSLMNSGQQYGDLP